LKLNDYFEFPLDLKLQNYVNDPSQGHSMDSVYQLRGVILHIGSAESGHYTSLVKDRNGEWLEFNDQEVTPFDIKKLADSAFGGKKEDKMMGSKSAYVLLYEKSASIAPLNTSSQINTKVETVPESPVVSAESPITNLVFMNEFGDYVINMLGTDKLYDLMTLQQFSGSNNFSIFKSRLLYFFCYLIRDVRRHLISDLYRSLRETLLNDVEASLFVLKNFRNQDVFREFLFNCPIGDMSNLAYGIIKFSLDCVRSKWATLNIRQQSIAVRFTRLVMNQLVLLTDSNTNVDFIWLIMESICENRYLCEVLRMMDFDNLIGKIFLGHSTNQLEILENDPSELEPMISEGLNLEQVTDSTNKNSYQIVSEVLSSITICTVANYYQCLGITSYPITYLSVPSQLSMLLMMPKTSKACRKLAEFLVICNTEMPSLIFDLLDSLVIAEVNFKTIFYLIKDFSFANHLELNDTFIRLLHKTIARETRLNYVYFDHLVHFVGELCCFNKSFFSSLLSERNFLTAMEKRNMATKSISLLDQSLVR